MSLIKQSPPRLTWECVPQQRARTSLQPASPSSNPGGWACGGLTERKGCPRTRIPECGGTSLLNVRLPPLQILEPGLGTRVVTRSQTARENLAVKPPRRPPDVSLQKSSMSLCLKAGVPVPLTRSSLRSKHSRLKTKVWLRCADER